MSYCFLILGYGIPKKFERDKNYNLYLKLAFKQIFAQTSQQAEQKTTIIFCGGPTDLFPPYKRTEATEMRRFFQKLAKHPTIKNATRYWRFYSETKSLSTLENLLFAALIIKQRTNDVRQIFIMGEKSRARRIRLLSQKIFKNSTVKVWPVDFSPTDRLYKNQTFIRKKERWELQHALSALKNPANLKKHHQLFATKIAHLRAVKPSQRSHLLRQWWQKNLPKHF